MSTPTITGGTGATTPVPAGTTFHVYVLTQYLDNRPTVPLTRAAADTALRHQYAIDNLANYPALRDHLESAILKEVDHRRAMQKWASDTLDRIALGQPVKFRPRLAEVLQHLWDARSTGLTREELCSLTERDGGSVSGALTNLQQGGVVAQLIAKR